MPTDITGDPAYMPSAATGMESRFSGVSWAAIVAGGVAAAAMALILMTLGAGLGLIAVSPWPGQGASAESVGVGVIVWSIVIEVAAFGLGGYLAGRLRTKWANMHGDEVYFRDTAHGFVTWALGTLVSIALFSVAAGHIVRTGAEVGAAGAAVAGGAGAAVMAAGPEAMGARAAPGRMSGNPMDYYIDALFRPANAPAAATTGTPANTGAATGTTSTSTPAAGAETPTSGASMSTTTEAAPDRDLAPVRAEIGRIAAQSVKDGELTLSAQDRGYIAQLVAQRTGLSQPEAEKRVDDVVGQAKAKFTELKTKSQEAADAARKAGAALAMWSFVAMLIGAFAASFAATLGGRHRDL